MNESEPQSDFNVEPNGEVPPWQDIESQFHDSIKMWGRVTKFGTENLDSPAAQFAASESDRLGYELSRSRRELERQQKQSLVSRILGKLSFSK